MDAKMEVRNGKPTVVINGEEQASIFYMRPESQSVFEATDQNKMVESGIELYSDCNGYLGKMEIWQQNGINFEKFDQDILQTISANPDAKLQVSVWMQAPNWWLQKNPGHQSIGLGKDGQVYSEDFGVSPASDLFREEAGEVLRQLVQHVIDSPYGNQVYSFRITMGKTHETIAPGYDEFTIPDYSEIAGIKYKEWLKERYGNDVSKLRKAWNNNTVTFETAEIPTVPERASSDYVSIYDPASQRNCLDYGLFLSDVIADDMIYFSEIVKEVTNNTRLVGTYYGYINAFTAAHASAAAHNSLERILNCPTIDWIMSPLNYGERDFGNSSTTMTVMDGAMAHGKLVYLECDNRTVFSYPNNGRQEEAMSNISMGVCYSMKETIAQLKRDFAYALSHGAGMEICDLWGGWFTDSQICSLLKEVKAEMDFANNIEYKKKAEIAVVLSNKTNLYTVFNQQNIYPMLYSLWNSQRQNLNTSGVPFDTYTISDVAEGKANDYSVYLMLSPFEISAEERAAIDANLKKDGKTVIWQWLSGISDGSKLDVKLMKELTGFNIGMEVREGSTQVEISDADSPFTEGLAGKRYGLDLNLPWVKTGPITYVDDPDAIPLGTLLDGGKTGLAVKDMGDWTSIYSTSTNIPNVMLNNIIKYNNKHIYSDNREDVIWANNHYVMIHCVSPRQKTIHLDGNYSVYDVFAGEFYSMNTDTIAYDHKEIDTKIFRLMTPNTYAVTANVKGGGGTISNSGLTEVPVGGSFTANVTPNKGYEIKSVTVNGKEVKVSGGKISFKNLSENLVIEARFSPIAGVTPPLEPEKPVINDKNRNNNSKPSTGGSQNEIIDNDMPDDGNDGTSNGSKTQTVRKKIVTEEMDILMTVLLIAGIVILIIAAGIILYFIIKKKKKDRKEANLQ